jgi:hypothetical protein
LPTMPLLVELLRSVCSLYSRNAREKPPPRLRVSIFTGDLSASPAHLPRAPLKMMQSFRPVWRETAIRKELGKALEGTPRYKTLGELPFWQPPNMKKSNLPSVRAA